MMCTKKPIHVRIKLFFTPYVDYIMLSTMLIVINLITTMLRLNCFQEQTAILKRYLEPISLMLLSHSMLVRF